MFEWRCGSCSRRHGGLELAELRTSSLDHIREARGRGVQEPLCGHCGQPICEKSLESHTAYTDDPSLGPTCGLVRDLAKLTGADA